MTEAPSNDRPPNLWLDLSDLVDWKGAPTGIQRVVVEYAHRLSQRPDLAVQGCAFRPHLREYVVVDIESTIAGSPTTPAASARESTAPESPTLATRFRGAAAAIDDRAPKIAAFARRLRHRLLATSHAETPSTGVSTTICPFNTGDHVLVLGANWLLTGYADHLAQVQGSHSLRITHMVHDVIPTAHQQWAATGASTIVTPYLQTMTRICTTIIAVSDCTRADIARLGDLGVLTLNPNGRLLTLTHGCDLPATRAVVEPPSGIDPNEPFVVCIGTLEIRKNHIVLYQAYREAERRGIQLPRLYLVGRSGWLAEATEHLIEHDPVTNDRITILRDLTDDNVAWLYEHCLFTVFPSVYEGWGLPVAESFGYGKLCLTSDCASLAEVSGEIAHSLSPYDARAWLDAMHHFASNPSELAERERVIRDEYTPRTWDDATNDLVSIITDHA